MIVIFAIQMGINTSNPAVNFLIPASFRVWCVVYKTSVCRLVYMTSGCGVQFIGLQGVVFSLQNFKSVVFCLHDFSYFHRTGL